jgi:desulfoferrodoxin (superoxide reductase-like protein)
MKKLFLLLPILFLFTSVSLLANKTRIEVKAPSEIKKGVEVTIIINVFHKGNSNGHHTDWVYLKINGKEVKRWEYAKDNLPPDENFTLEFKYVVNEESAIVAEGHCNIHGSAGIQKATIKTN